MPNRDAVASHGPPSRAEGRGDDVIGGVGVVVEVGHGPIFTPIGAAGKPLGMVVHRPTGDESSIPANSAFDRAIRTKPRIRSSPAALRSSCFCAISSSL